MMAQALRTFFSKVGNFFAPKARRSKVEKLVIDLGHKVVGLVLELVSKTSPIAKVLKAVQKLWVHVTGPEEKPLRQTVLARIRRLKKKLQTATDNLEQARIRRTIEELQMAVA